MKTEMNSSNFGGTKYWTILSLVAILLGITYVYRAAFPGDFIHEDIVEVQSNHRMGDLTELLSASTLGVKAPARPLAYASFSINQAMLSAKPLSFLRVNVMIHAVCSLLLLRLLWLLGSSSEQASVVSSRMLPVAALTLIWATHPLNVHSVAYIYQRVECLMTCFFLASAIQIVHYLRKPTWTRMMLATSFGVLASLSLEIAAVIPFLPFILSVVDKQVIAMRLRRALTISFPLLLTWPMVVLYMLPQVKHLAWIERSVDHNSWIQLSNELQLVIHSLNSFFAMERLSFVYDWARYSSLSEVAFPLSIITIVIALGIYFVWRGNLIGAGILWFTICFGSAFSVLPKPLPADDGRAYLPLIGLVIVSLGLVRCFEPLFHKQLKLLNMSVGIAMLVLVIPMAQSGRERAGRFASRLAIWTDALESQRANFSAACKLSSIYLEMKQYSKAETHAMKAIDADPKNPKPWGLLANAQINQGKAQEAEATLTKALESTSDDGSIAFVQGIVLAQKNAQNAITAYEQAVSLDPSNDAAWNNLGVLLARNEATYDRAEDCYKKSLLASINNRSAYQNLAALHIKSGSLYDAREILSQANRVFKSDSDIRSRLATVGKLIREREQEQRKIKNTSNPSPAERL